MGFDAYRKPRLPGSSKTPVWLLFFAVHLFLYAGVVVAHMLLPQDLLKYYILAGALGAILIFSTILMQVVVGSRISSLGNMLQQDPQVIIGDPQCVLRLSRIPWYGVSEIDILQLAILQTYNAYAIDSKVAGKQLAKVSTTTTTTGHHSSRLTNNVLKRRWKKRHAGGDDRPPADDTSSSIPTNSSPYQQAMLNGKEGGGVGLLNSIKSVDDDDDDDASFHTADSFEYEPARIGDKDDSGDETRRFQQGRGGGGVGLSATSRSRVQRMGYALGRKLRVVKEDEVEEQQVNYQGENSLNINNQYEGGGDGGGQQQHRDYYALAVPPSSNNPSKTGSPEENDEKRSLLISKNNNNKKKNNNSGGGRIQRLFGRRSKQQQQQQQGANRGGGSEEEEEEGYYSADVEGTLYSCSSGGDNAASNNRKAAHRGGEASSKSPSTSPPLTYGTIPSPIVAASSGEEGGGGVGAGSASSPPPESFGEGGRGGVLELLSPAVATLHHTSSVKEYDPLNDNGSSWDVVQKGITDPGKSLLLQLLGQVKVGQGLSTVTLPVTILECRSLLERLSDMCVHWSYLLPVATETITDDYQRMVAVFKWFIAAYRMKPAGARKPYNPILGEVFHCIVHNGDDPRYPQLRQAQQQQFRKERGRKNVDGSGEGGGGGSAAAADGIDAIEFIAEQVSHHPPASAIYARHKNLIELKGIYHPHSKLVSLNCAASLAEGSFDVLFPQVPRGGEHHHNTKKHHHHHHRKQHHHAPPQHDSTTTTNLNDDDVSNDAHHHHSPSLGRRYNITWPSFFASGIVSGNPRMEIGGTVTITDVDTGIVAKVEFLRKGWLSGEYDLMECVILSPEGKNIQGKKYFGTWFDTIYMSDVNAKGSMVGPKHVFHSPTTAAPGAARPQTVPTPGHPKQSRGVWRELTRCLREEDQAGASDAKNLVENTQRQERKELAAAGKEAVPRFFKFMGEQNSDRTNRGESTAEVTEDEAADEEVAVRAFKAASESEKYDVKTWEFTGEASLVLEH